MSGDGASGEDHPIVERTVELLEPTLEGSYDLPPQAQQRLESDIDRYLGSNELPEVVDALLRLAHVLEVDACSDLAAAAVCAALERDVVIKGLRRGRVSEADPAESGRAFRQFAQDSPRKISPEEPPSEGLLRPHEWKGPRRV